MSEQMNEVEGWQKIAIENFQGNTLPATMTHPVISTIC